MYKATGKSIVFVLLSVKFAFKFILYQGEAAYSCRCPSVCSAFDIPENWNRCPSFYLDFEDNTNCSIGHGHTDVRGVSHYNNLK